MDASILKAFPVTERSKFDLSMTAYNALNQMYLGTGQAAVNSSAFTKNIFNTSGTVPSGTGFISGNRFVVLMGKIVFRASPAEHRWLSIRGREAI